FEISRDVGNRLALAERHVRLQRHDLTAQLANGDLEGRSGAQRWFVEQQPDVPALQRISQGGMTDERSIPFQLRGEPDAALEIDGVEVEHRQEVLALGGVRWCHNRVSPPSPRPPPW